MMSKLQLALGYNMIEAPISMMIKLRLALGSKLKGGTHLLLQPIVDHFSQYFRLDPQSQIITKSTYLFSYTRTHVKNLLIYSYLQ